MQRLDPNEDVPQLLLRLDPNEDVLPNPLLRLKDELPGSE